jgi:hypothetical protein
MSAPEPIGDNLSRPTVTFTRAAHLAALQGRSADVVHILPDEPEEQPEPEAEG